MTAKKRSTAKSKVKTSPDGRPGEVRDFDPRRGRVTAQTFEYAAVTVHFQDGTTQTVNVPILPGDTPGKIQERAEKYAFALRRVDSAWRHDLSEKEVSDRADVLMQTASFVYVENLIAITEERFGGDAVASLFGGAYEQILDKQAALLTASMKKNELDQVIRDIERQATAGVLIRLEAQHGARLQDVDDTEYSRLFREAWNDHYVNEAAEMLHFAAQDIARALLEEIKAGEATLDQIAALLKPSHDAVGRASTSDALYTPTDRAIQGIVKWVGGRLDPVDFRDGYAKLPDIRTKSLRTHLQVRESPDYLAELITPENVEPVLAGIQAERNETKAKTLVAAYALASAPTTRDPTSFEVDIHEFVSLITGYKRSGPKKTRSDYYWRKFAEVLRYLQVDLASLQVNIRRTRTGAKAEEVLGEYLMHRPRLVSEQGFAYMELYDQLKTLIIAGGGRAGSEEEKQAIAFLHHLQPTAVRLGFPEAIMRSFGHHSNALEKTNREVLTLTGPAFWLAYDIAFRRRWSKPKNLKPGGGLPLLQLLEEHGFLEVSRNRTGGRTSYKHALDEFFSSVDRLLALGELDDPGIRVWRFSGGPGRPKDVHADVKRWIKTRGKRITEADLEPLKVQYVFPEGRVKALENARKNAERKAARKPFRPGAPG